MILPRYRIADSTIPGAGKGLFLDQPVQAGCVLTAPDAIDRTWSAAEIAASETLQNQLHAAARWFEDRYTLSPEWPDECYVNHSFQPTGLWHSCSASPYLNHSASRWVLGCKAHSRRKGGSLSSGCNAADGCPAARPSGAKRAGHGRVAALAKGATLGGALRLALTCPLGSEWFK